jgi:UDP-2,4-diacetamido-2,4,6-trideoxy-beta-L-altropyranose hydrolase
MIKIPFTIAIRVDGSSDIGMGHIMRCLALSQALSDRGAKVIFICRKSSPAAIRKIRSNGINCHSIKSAGNEKADWDASYKILRRENAQALIVDHYGLRYCYHSKTRQAGYKLITIVDQPLLRKYVADILVNQNVESNPKGYNFLPETKILFGPRYALLRKQFLNFARRRRNYKNKTKFRVLITLGGADPANQTLKVLKAAVRVPQISNCTVVLGMAFKHGTSIKDFCIKHQQTIPLESPPSMPKLMVGADFAISAAGTTCYELAYMGLPNLALVLAPNQKDIASGLESLGVSKNLGYYSKATIRSIRHEIEKLITMPEEMTIMSREGKRLIDGKGSQRLAEEILAECAKTKP